MKNTLACFITAGMILKRRFLKATEKPCARHKKFLWRAA